jgi:hypothetical protein
MLHKAGTQRIQLDVPVAGEQVRLRLHDARAVAALPKRARAFVRAIHVLGLELGDVLHEAAAPFGRRRRQEQVNVIGHEAVRMEITIEAVQRTAQAKKIKGAVGIGMKARSAIVAPLNEMHR